MNDELKKQLEFEEGFRSKVYLCPAGKRTIGFGHNLDAQPWFRGSDIPDEISLEFARELLNYDLLRARRGLFREWALAMLLSQPRMDACINMVFQLGIAGFMEFRKLRKALAAGDWQKAHDEALNSAWAKQTPGRAKRVAWQLLHDQYYEIPS